MKAKYVIIALLAISFWGCDDNTGKLGLDMFPESDQKINGKLSTFDVTTESIEAGRIFAKTNLGYVGKFTDEEFGLYEAGFLAQLNCPDLMTFPQAFSGDTESGKGEMMTNFENTAEGVGKNYTIIKDESGNEIGNCQISIYLWYDNYFGDSLTACRLSMYELDQKNGDKYWSKDPDAYYTNIDPEKYYDKTTSFLGSKSYTAVDLSISDSIRNLSSYNPYISITLDQQKTQELGKLIIQGGRTNELYKEFKDIFPGVYIKSDYGDGTILYIKDLQMDVRFLEHATDSITGGKLLTSAGKDSVVYNGRSFNSTREVIQANRLENDQEKIQECISNPNWTYLKSPAGIFTEATLPINEIEKALQGDTLNAVKLTFSNYNQPNKKFGMPIPSTVLLIRKAEIDLFFKDNKLTDGVSSFLTSHTSSTNQYTFSNITKLINACIADKEKGSEWLAKNPDWDKVVLIPVLVTYDSSSSSGYGSPNVIGIQHDLKPGYVRLKGGLKGSPDHGNDDANKLKLEVISTNFGSSNKQ